MPVNDRKDSMRRTTSSIVLGILLSIVPETGNGEGIRAVVVRVVDGDTLVVALPDNRTETVRLIGIDTPESKENRKARRDARRSGRSIDALVREGRTAANALRTQIKPGDTVTLEFDTEKRDKYGRLLAYVYTRSGIMVNYWLIRKGYARPYIIPPNTRYQYKLRK